jgi:hypothetical protein
MQLNEKSVAVNEYGTNLVKYKYDPLAVIEAKTAMNHGKGGCNKISPAIEEEAEGEVGSVHLTQPSPRTGTQEAPEAVWSSQEVNGEESDIDKEGKLGNSKRINNPPTGKSWKSPLKIRKWLHKNLSMGKVSKLMWVKNYRELEKRI